MGSKHDSLLRERLGQLIIEIEALKLEAEKKIQALEATAKGRLLELEDKLALLEENTWVLHQVVASMSPDRRKN